MPFALSVYKKQHVPMVRFISAGHDLAHPQVDTRGYLQGPAAPIVGLTAGSPVQVILMRHLLPNEAPLFLSTEGGVEVDRAVRGRALPAQRSIHVGLSAARSAASGESPTNARVSVHLGAATGPVVCELTVKIYERQTLRLALHDAGGFIDCAEAFRTVGHIFEQAGIALRFHPRSATRPAHDVVASFDLHGPDDITSIVNGEENRALSSFVEEHVNVYFVRNISLHASSGVIEVWGLGMAGMALAGLANLSADFGLERPVMFVATAGLVEEAGDRVQEMLARILAHELGHMTGLAHVDGANGGAARGERTDTFSRRNLMHPSLPFTPISSPVTDDNAWREDVGFGRQLTGHMLTQKALPRRTVAMDDQVTTMRRNVVSGAVYRVGS